MTLKKKRRDPRGEVQAWMQAGRRGSVREIAHALDLSDAAVYGALKRLEVEGIVSRKRAVRRALDALGRIAPTLSDEWGLASDQDDEAAPAARPMTTVERALAARPQGVPTWLGGAGS